MFSKSAFIAAVAVTVSAEILPLPGHLALKRELLARQTGPSPQMTAVPTATMGDDGDAQCMNALLSIYSELPTPPADLMSYEMTATDTDHCSPSVPDSMTSDFSSYSSVIMSFYTQHSADISSALSACPQYSSYTSGFPVCTGSGSGTSASATAKSGTNGTAAGTASGTGRLSTPTATHSAGAAGGSSGTTTAGAAGIGAGLVGSVLAAAALFGAMVAL